MKAEALAEEVSLILNGVNDVLFGCQQGRVLVGFSVERFFGVRCRSASLLLLYKSRGRVSLNQDKGEM